MLGRAIGVVIALSLASCSSPTSGPSHERLIADVQETAAAMFVSNPPTGLGPEPLTYRGAGIYATATMEEAGGGRTWHVRAPRADLILLPLTAVERLTGVEIKADIVIRYEYRSCDQPPVEPATWRCEGWQETNCCNRVWVWRQGAWISQPAN